MKKNAITSALKDRLETLGFNVVYPNVTPDDFVRPYISVEFSASRRENPSVTGGAYFREFGVMTASVVVDEGTGVAAAENMADDVSDAFPKALRIAVTGGAVIITNPADIRAGFHGQSGDWRVPVNVAYMAERTP